MATQSHPAPERESEFVSTKEAAHILDVSVWTIYRLRAAGKLHGFKIGAKIRRYRRADVIGLLEEMPSISDLDDFQW